MAGMDTARCSRRSTRTTRSETSRRRMRPSRHPPRSTPLPSRGSRSDPARRRGRTPTSRSHTHPRAARTRSSHHTRLTRLVRTHVLLPAPGRAAAGDRRELVDLRKPFALAVAAPADVDRTVRRSGIRRNPVAGWALIARRPIARGCSGQHADLVLALEVARAHAVRGARRARDRGRPVASSRCHERENPAHWSKHTPSRPR